MDNHQLPVIANCDGCGACCMEQESPPGYAMLLQRPKLGKGPLAKDLRRVENLPKAARQELLDYIEQRKAREPREDLVCIWLDRETKQCRWYEHRPSVCRDGVNVGDEACRLWRLDYGVATKEEREAALADDLRGAIGK